MILDNILTYNQKIIISIISGMVWIYYRTMDCYKFLPRRNILPTIFVGIWIYLNYKEPLFLPIGLIIIVIYKILNTEKNSQ